MMTMTERYYTKKIKDFLKIKDVFCEERNINNSFKEFLFHEKNDFCSPAFYVLHLCPKIYLVNSKIFKKYYYSLDKDFRDDLLTGTEFHENLIFIKRNKKILKMLKSVQKNDSIL